MVAHFQREPEPESPTLTCVCCNCFRERTTADEWRDHTPLAGERLTHGICPECVRVLYPELAPLIYPRT